MFASSVLCLLSFKALTSRQHDKVFQDILKFISKASKQLDKLNQLITAAARLPQAPTPGAQPKIGKTSEHTHNAYIARSSKLWWVSDQNSIRIMIELPARSRFYTFVTAKWVCLLRGSQKNV